MTPRDPLASCSLDEIDEGEGDEEEEDDEDRRVREWVSIDTGLASGSGSTCLNALYPSIWVASDFLHFSPSFLPCGPFPFLFLFLSAHRFS